MKNIKKILVFIFVLAISFLIVKAIYDIDNPNKKYKIANNEKYDVVNLGTSHGYSFTYGFYGINGRRFNRGGNTLYYDLQIYKEIRESLNENALVFIPISYFSFGQAENGGSKEGAQGTNTFVDEFYYRLPPQAIKDYSVSKHLDLITTTLRANVSKVFSRELKYRNYTPSSFNYKAYLNKSYKEKNAKSINLKNHGVNRAKYHKKEAVYIEDDRNIEYLKMLIKEIKKDNCKPIIILTPYHSEYNKHFDASWRNKYVLDKIDEAAKNENVDILDYSNDPRFSKNKKYFKNTDHLNAKGRIEFTKTLFKDLEKDEIIDRNYHKIRSVTKFENKKITENLLLKNLEVIQDTKAIYFMFHYEGDMKNITKEALVFHLKGENNKKVLVTNKKIKDKRNINNTIVFSIPIEKFKETNKIKFNLMIPRNKKAVILSDIFEFDKTELNLN
ncbi:hypothetical protein [uncultured Kordia sp.]|uniref:hypothetical protein n=1 Tax=uncultured Kordia sp. TaxID=507699 RepID=UPI002638A07F|nr:hypothetical protein [uncultured Kordia sp.]